ncbi:MULTISPECIES: hypothetical protein [unclassified Bartonella]|uniref:hypothetical protein n=1 Tax=unclassified Bartonella TaxID=2645622 RepID=UPI0035CF3E79
MSLSRQLFYKILAFYPLLAFCKSLYGQELAHEKCARSYVRASWCDKPLLRCLSCEGLKQIHRGDFVSLSRQVLPIVLSDAGILSIIGVL